MPPNSTRGSDPHPSTNSPIHSVPNAPLPALPAPPNIVYQQQQATAPQVFLPCYSTTGNMYFYNPAQTYLPSHLSVPQQTQIQQQIDYQSPHIHTYIPRSDHQYPPSQTYFPSVGYFPPVADQQSPLVPFYPSTQSDHHLAYHNAWLNLTMGSLDTNRVGLHQQQGKSDGQSFEKLSASEGQLQNNCDPNHSISQSPSQKVLKEDGKSFVNASYLSEARHNAYLELFRLRTIAMLTGNDLKYLASIVGDSSDALDDAIIHYQDPLDDLEQMVEYCGSFFAYVEAELRFAVERLEALFNVDKESQNASRASSVTVAGPSNAANSSTVASRGRSLTPRTPTQSPFARIRPRRANTFDRRVAHVQRSSKGKEPAFDAEADYAESALTRITLHLKNWYPDVPLQRLRKAALEILEGSVESREFGLFELSDPFSDPDVESAEESSIGEVAKGDCGHSDSDSCVKLENSEVDKASNAGSAEEKESMNSDDKGKESA